MLSVAFGTLADGSGVAVTGGEDGSVRVWDVPSGTLRAGPLLLEIEGPVLSVAFGTLADGTWVAVSGGMDGTVRMWDLSGNMSAGVLLTVHKRPVRAVVVTSLGGVDIVLAGGDDATIGSWNAATHQPLR